MIGQVQAIQTLRRLSVCTVYRVYSQSALSMVRVSLSPALETDCTAGMGWNLSRPSLSLQFTGEYTPESSWSLVQENSEQFSKTTLSEFNITIENLAFIDEKRCII